MMRNKFSEDIFKQKYMHEGAQTWAELATTLVEDVCREKMKKSEKDALAKHITDMKFLPGGRYLYYAGRSKKFFNNCAKGSTKILTDKGYETMDSYTDGQDMLVYSPVARAFLPANMHTHSEQQLYKITFENIRGRSTKQWEVEFTANHRWPTLNRGEVTDLKRGDVIGAAQVELTHNALAFLHGLVFADGNVHILKNGYGHQLRLCGDKAKYVNLFNGYTVNYPEFANGDPVVYLSSHFNMKELPTADATPEYIASFVKGWIALDGCKSIGQIHSINKAAIDYFVEYSSLAGMIVSGSIRVNEEATNYGERKNSLYYVNYSLDFPGFKVVHIEPTTSEIVYCPFEPIHNRIVIDYGIDTYQCYLLRSLEDTREDWADLSKRAETCLATGGGIGNDYSVYRKSGSVLHGTGGVASGPISKMLMVNEIGRQIMQGGSRRSAIYASLNWRHGDAGAFLKAKDWKAMPVGSTGLSIWDIKQQDFNFPAPLDMTNISLNYDTDWLLNYWKTGDMSETFLANVRQALSTGEPGFSFNFFDKENETLRNACTEVTSEDDSDVCNLGSLNLSRIETVDEMTEITELATKFLVCGTLVADLPYEQVYKTREKNRRLGLGLMGMHEWLVQRGYKYEVTPEMHRWLAIYKGVSDEVAAKFSSELCISNPVARRAIAPTGTIGILAGTTTGIEPVFSVAYKRRFLKGTKWHYQYVVDGAAKDVIDRYGVDPDNIDSALDLSKDFERRIKFQADVQDYVDMAISSTINLPAWGTEGNNEDNVNDFARTLASYAHRLRGFTCYPDGSRGGQPLTSVPYSEAVEKLGETFEENVAVHDVCDITGRGGSCGV